MGHVYEVKSEGQSEIREASELACDLIAKGAVEIKKRIPHAEAFLDAIERVALVMRSAAMDGVPRDIIVSVHPDEDTASVTSVVNLPPAQGGVQ